MELSSKEFCQAALVGTFILLCITSSIQALFAFGFTSAALVAFSFLETKKAPTADLERQMQALKDKVDALTLAQGLRRG